MVFGPDMVVKPGSEVTGAKVNAPETVPSRLIFPIPAFSVVLLASITPVSASPSVMLELVAATVPWMVNEEGAVATSPAANVVTSPEVPFKTTAPVLRKATFCANVLPVPVIETV